MDGLSNASDGRAAPRPGKQLDVEPTPISADGHTIDLSDIKAKLPALIGFAGRRHRIVGAPSQVEPSDWVNEAIRLLLRNRETLPCPQIAWLKRTIFRLSTNYVRSQKRAPEFTTEDPQDGIDPSRLETGRALSRRVVLMLGALVEEARQSDVAQLLETYGAGITIRGEVAEYLEVEETEVDRRRAVLRRMIGKLPSALVTDVRDFLDSSS